MFRYVHVLHVLCKPCTLCAEYARFSSLSYQSIMLVKKSKISPFMPNGENDFVFAIIIDYNHYERIIELTGQSETIIERW